VYEIAATLLRQADACKLFDNGTGEIFEWSQTGGRSFGSQSFQSARTFTYPQITIRLPFNMCVGIPMVKFSRICVCLLLLSRVSWPPWASYLAASLRRVPTLATNVAWTKLATVDGVKCVGDTPPPPWWLKCWSLPNLLIPNLLLYWYWYWCWYWYWYRSNYVSPAHHTHTKQEHVLPREVPCEMGWSASLIAV